MKKIILWCTEQKQPQPQAECFPPGGKEHRQKEAAHREQGRAQKENPEKCGAEQNRLGGAAGRCGAGTADAGVRYGTAVKATFLRISRFKGGTVGSVWTE